MLPRISPKNLSNHDYLSGSLFDLAEGCRLRLHQKGPSGPKLILPDGHTDGRTDRRTEGRTDGWTEG